MSQRRENSEDWELDSEGDEECLSALEETINSPQFNKLLTPTKKEPLEEGQEVTPIGSQNSPRPGPSNVPKASKRLQFKTEETQSHHERHNNTTVVIKPEPEEEEEAPMDTQGPQPVTRRNRRVIDSDDEDDEDENNTRSESETSSVAEIINLAPEDSDEEYESAVIQPEIVTRNKRRSSRVVKYASSEEKSTVEEPPHKSEYWSEDSDDSMGSFVVSDPETDETSNASESSYESEEPYDHHMAMIDNEAASKGKGKKRKAGKGSKKQKRKKRKRNGDIEEEEDDESDAESEGDKDFKEAQEVSIHRILQNRVKLDTDLSNRLNLDKITLEEAQILQIIEDYNKAPTRAIESQFMEESVKNKPRVSQEDSHLFKGKEFKIKVFVVKTPKQLKIMSSYGIKCESTAVHIIIFHYREDEIFALTTNQAWNAVQRYSDYSFPGKIADRLLSEKGVIEETSKKLVGNSLSEKKTRKEHQASNPFEMVSLVVSSTAAFRDRSSIYKFSAFRGKKGVKVNIGMAHVRIKRRLQTSDFLVILSHFSEIARGLTTYLMPDLSKRNDGSEDEDEDLIERDTDVHQRILTKAATETAKELDMELSWRIRQAMMNPALVKHLQHFNIQHKYFEEFANATEFKLKYKNTVFYDFEENGRPPTINEIINNLRECESLMAPYNPDLLPQPRRTFRNEREWFKERINKTRLIYKPLHGILYKQESLLKCFEGLQEHPRDGRYYWKVLGEWCNIRDDYLILVHRQFLHLLERSYIGEGEDDTLETPWAPEDNVQEYISRHEELFGFLVWKKDEEGDGEPIFDLAKFNEDKQLCIYFVMQGFDSEMRKIVKRIKSAPLEIKSANSHSTTTPRRRRNPQSQSRSVTNRSFELINKFYNANSNNEFFVINQITNVHRFIDLLSKAKVILAISQPDSNGEMEEFDFEREKNLKKEINVEMISGILNRKKNRVIVEKLLPAFEIVDWVERMEEASLEIFNSLVNADYIDGNGGMKNKLLMATRDNFSALKIQRDHTRKDLKKFNEIIFDLFIKDMKSGFNAYLPKLELQSVSSKFSENPDNEFKICQIPIRKSRRNK